jgi:hypothetical protein
MCAWCSGGGERGREKRERERGRAVSDARVYCIWQAKGALQGPRVGSYAHETQMLTDADVC